MSQTTSPERSFAQKRAGRSPPLSLDLSDLPPLSQPTPPSNTLLITGLYDLTLFQPPAINKLKAQIEDISTLNSFSPLPSLRRLVCSFKSIDAAIAVRKVLDGEALQGKKVRAKVYFGEHTPVENAEEARKRKLLGAPQSEKMFFISPPPSPPHGWEMRNEDPPNKEVHASDLADALNKLGKVPGDETSEENRLPETPASISEGRGNGDTFRPSTWTSTASAGSGQRSRSGTLIYHPQDHGDSPDLPAVMVEDTSIANIDSDSDCDISEPPRKKILAHTTRPPVELIE